jgi:hypothetical protein
MQYEKWLEDLISCLETARTIVYALAAFSLGAIYISVFSTASQRAELSAVRAELIRVHTVLATSDKVLANIRLFYEGPVEAERLNFASLIYALDVVQHHLQNTLNSVDRKALKPADIAFLEFQADLIRNNAFELTAIVGGLIKQKTERIPFESLSISDLLDLDYHKGKDAWNLYYEWSSLRYALYNERSYGYVLLPKGLDSLEKRYRYYLEEAQKTRRSSTRPVKTVRDSRVTTFVNEMLADGFRSVGEIRAHRVALEKKILTQETSLNSSLKLPFIDQTVGVDSLAWLVPLTVLISIAFALFYIESAYLIWQQLLSVNSDLRFGIQSFPWVFLKLEPANPSIHLLSTILGIMLLVLPIGVSLVLLINSANSPFISRVTGTLLTAISFVGIMLMLRALKRFRLAIWEK